MINEFQRIKALASYNLEYDALQDKFSDVTKLATVIAETEISLINILDADSQWSIARQGTDLPHISKSESVCQYTIQEEIDYEVEDLRLDPRFIDRTYVKDTGLSYYYGIPLKTSEGEPIGALCVLNDHNPKLNAKRKNMLRLLANEVIGRLNDLKHLADTENKNKLLENQKRILAHDLRGPLGGIKGLADVAIEEGKAAVYTDFLEYFKLIKDSSQSVLEMAEEILQHDIKTVELNQGETTLQQIREKLWQLFAPRLKDKKLRLNFLLSELTADDPINKFGLQQILGNLISNAIKFTPEGGSINVQLDLKTVAEKKELIIKVADSGIGMDKNAIQRLLGNGVESSQGTDGELGYGLGLQLVKQLITDRNGNMDIVSEPGSGSCFTITLSAI
jgi:signal transduction histidine kinase